MGELVSSPHYHQLFYNDAIRIYLLSVYFHENKVSIYSSGG